MKKEIEYKETGLEWCPQIPKHWELKRLKYLLSARLEYGANESAEQDNRNEPRYLRITDFDDNGKLRSNTFKSLPYEVAKPFLLKEGDILFARSGATVGKTFIFSNYDGEACFAGYLIRARHNEKIIPQYLYLYTKSGAYNSWKNSVFIQATIQNIGAEKYSQLEVPLPPLPEQQKIADYLDQKTTLIDSIIAKKEKQIELYKEERTAIINHAVTRGLNPDAKMKDSGIEWLGEIPAHWEVKRLKYLLKEKKGALKTGPFGTQLKTSDYVTMSDNTIKVYTQRNVLDNDFSSGEDYINDDKFDELSSFEIFENDLLVTTRGSIGRSAIFKFGNARGVLHPCLIRLQLNENKVLIDWVRNYFNNTSYFLENVKMESNSTIIEVIYGGTLSEISLPIPKDLDEQKSILSYLDQETLRIDALIEKTTKQIDLLKEYKEALINEVVTGKKIID